MFLYYILLLIYPMIQILIFHLLIYLSNLQNLNYHKDWVYKIIELKNKSLVSCSYKSIIFYIKDNNSKYFQELKITTNRNCCTVIQTKNNEICYSEYKDNYSICFCDLKRRKKKHK